MWGMQVVPIHHPRHCAIWTLHHCCTGSPWQSQICSKRIERPPDLGRQWELSRGVTSECPRARPPWVCRVWFQADLSRIHCVFRVRCWPKYDTTELLGQEKISVAHCTVSISAWRILWDFIFFYTNNNKLPALKLLVYSFANYTMFQKVSGPVLPCLGRTCVGADADLLRTASPGAQPLPLKVGAVF